jgi:hypothetical protein
MTITEEGSRPDPTKVDVIENFPWPEIEKQLKRREIPWNCET